MKEIDRRGEQTSLSTIFFTFFRLGFIAFGGGYSMIPLVEREVVDRHGILDKERFVNAISIAEGLPGAIALNVSIFVGYTAKGFKGAVAAALGSLFPSLILMTIIMTVFSNISTLPIVQKAMGGIRPVVAGLILYAAYKISKHAYKYKQYAFLTVIGFGVAMFAKNIPLPFLIIGGLAAGILLNMIEKKLRMGVEKRDE